MGRVPGPLLARAPGWPSCCACSSSIEIPVLCLLVNSDPSTLEVGRGGRWGPGPPARAGMDLELTRPAGPPCPPHRISRAVEHAGPWLILAGSGGIADMLAAPMNQPHLLVPQVAEKQFREKFPSENFSWEDIVHWTELVCTGQDRSQEGQALVPAPDPAPCSAHARPLWLQSYPTFPSSPLLQALTPGGGASVCGWGCPGPSGQRAGILTGGCGVVYHVPGPRRQLGAFVHPQGAGER